MAYQDLKRMVYDINIEMGFLDNPYLDTPDHREYLYFRGQKPCLLRQGWIMAAQVFRLKKPSRHWRGGASLSYLKSLSTRLHDHVILHIVMGYISKLHNNSDQHHACYRNALMLLRDESLADIFAKYLEWGYCVINDFNASASYVKERK